MFNNPSIVYLENSDVSENGSVSIPQPVMITMLYASYCGYCHKAAPEVDALVKSVDPNKVLITVVDIQEESKLAERFSKWIPVPGVPTFIVFRNGKIDRTYDGARNAQAMQAFLASY